MMKVFWINTIWINTFVWNIIVYCRFWKILVFRKIYVQDNLQKYNFSSPDLRYHKYMSLVPTHSLKFSLKLMKAFRNYANWKFWWNLSDLSYLRNEYSSDIFQTPIETRQNTLNLSWKPVQPFVKYPVYWIFHRRHS